MTQQQVDAHDALARARIHRDAALLRRDEAETNLHNAMLHVIRCEDKLRRVKKENAEAAFIDAA